MRKIKLTQGKFALVDDNDFEWLSQWKWYAAKKSHRWYARRQCWNAELKINQGKREHTFVAMHREILNTREGLQTDHIDGNGLNNQRHNLRECTRSQNLQNQRRTKSGGYKGVFWAEKSKKWVAQINADGVVHYLGQYVHAEAAAHEYDKLAKFLHGEFACPNFPEGDINA